ncbi:MAG: electron transfer flavoprotein subunit alpha/FixB family protein [SAR324 cluster bacterium]|nr:electron transfer flavoprotein subunit alpha/FixB family protein [SAR324 cluster bacterium]
MTENQNPVWVIAEHEAGQIQTVSSQLIGHARKLADELKTQVEVVLLGSGIAELPRQLFAAGADRVYLGDSPELKLYQSELHTEIIVGLAEAHQPDILLLGSTTMGRELAPLVAARLKTGLTAHCIDLVLDPNGILQQKIPAYGGMITIICPEKRPQMATVAKGVFPTPEFNGQREGEVMLVQIPTKIPNRLQTIEIVLEEKKGVPMESASIIVAGGAGAGGQAGWREITDLAKTLGAAVGATRPAVDEGWTHLETMIGQSGKMVGPECYIGVGLSGELQHMVGIVGARIMAAVNNDPKSPIFEQVDYGVVDDCREFVPVLIEKLKENC